MSIALRKPTRPEDVSLAFETGRKLGIVEMALMWKGLHEAPQCPSRVVLEKVAQREVPIAVSVRHLNRLRVKWNLNRRKGRPSHPALSHPARAGAALVQVTPHLAFVGVHLFAHWLDQQETFTSVVVRLQQAVEAYKHT